LDRLVEGLGCNPLRQGVQGRRLHTLSVSSCRQRS
jgi:hypothetical protein